MEDKEFRNKVLEMGAGGLSELVFTGHVIEVLGLGLTLLDIARSIENERMLGGVGPEADRWRYNKKLEFVFAILAEDLSKRQCRRASAVPACQRGNRIRFSRL